MSNMSDEKKARLEAIRAAKRAAQGDAPAAPAAEAPVAAAATQAPAAATTAAAPAAAGANMSDDKKAKLEAIRAANAAKKAAAGAAPVVTAAAAAPAPVTTTGTAPAAAATPKAAPAAPAARPAPAPKTADPVADDRAPVTVLFRRILVGAFFGIILCLLLSTMTGNYIIGAAWGAILGGIAGALVLAWPPRNTTAD